ncbi:MAG: hypothetical protein HY907_01365 [Deltaproteobacteria bacterium]|nr:hypothetical protein [Deltaproteobacteria bacterium]
MRRIAPLLPAVLAFLAPPAAADDLLDFEHAMDAYRSSDYPAAIERFRALVDPGREPLPSRAIREECLKYLGAALLFQGATNEASAAFERLLVLDPDAELDEGVFPAPILDAFRLVKNQMRERLEELRRAELELAERRMEEYRKRLEELGEALRPRYLVRRDNDHSLFLAFVPFGVGQFQNGEDAKGWTLFGVEAALFAANAWTFLAWDWYTREAFAANTSDVRRQQAADYANGYKIASWAVLGTLLATMVGGIIDALVFYDESTSWQLLPPEDVPEDLRLPVRRPEEFLLPPDDSVPAHAPDAAPPVSLSWTWWF